MTGLYRPVLREGAGLFFLQASARCPAGRCAMRAWQEQKPFRDMLEQDETVTSHLTPAELDECFELAYHYKHVDEVFKRLGLKK